MSRFRHITDVFKETSELTGTSHSLILGDMFCCSSDSTAQHKPVGLLSTSDQLDANISTWQHTTLTRDKTSMPSAGFEPANPASDPPQILALDRAVTGIGLKDTLLTSFSITFGVFSCFWIYTLVTYSTCAYLLFHALPLCCCWHADVVFFSVLCW